MCWIYAITQKTKQDWQQFAINVCKSDRHLISATRCW